MIQDFRFAFRSLARRKALFLMAVATLAVGVGASTSLFSMVNGVLLQPFPIATPTGWRCCGTSSATARRTCRRCIRSTTATTAIAARRSRS